MFIATRSNTHRHLAGWLRGMLASLFMEPCVLMVLTAHQVDMRSSEPTEFVVEKMVLLFNSTATVHVILPAWHVQQNSVWPCQDLNLFSGNFRPKWMNLQQFIYIYVNSVLNAIRKIRLCVHRMIMKIFSNIPIKYWHEWAEGDYGCSTSIMFLKLSYLKNILNCTGYSSLGSHTHILKRIDVVNEYIILFSW